MESNYRSLLLRIDNELHDEDLRSLKFLSLPYVGRRQGEKIVRGHELFEALERKDVICKSDMAHLSKLLNLIGRNDLSDLLEEIFIQTDSAISMTSRSNKNQDFCFFLEMLYKISEDMGKDDVSNLRFLFHDIPRSRQIESGVDLFSVLIERNIIEPSKLDLLITHLETIGRNDLKDNVLDFKETYTRQDKEQNSTFQIEPKSSAKIPEMSSEIVPPYMDEIEMKKSENFSETLLQTIGVRLSKKDVYPCEYEKEICSSTASFWVSHPPPTNISPKIKDDKEWEKNGKLCKSPVNSGDAVTHLADADTLTLPRYKMDADPRGVCLVIDNSTFTCNPNDPAAKMLKLRRGSEVDTEKIKNCFQMLHFDVRIKCNLDDTEMLQWLQQHATDRETNMKSDCFVVFILSHGNLNQGMAFVYGSNGRKVYMDNVMKVFKPDYCPSLAGKPKLFFLACCLGGSFSRAVPRPLHLSEAMGEIEADVAVSDDEFISSHSFVCNDQDFLIGYSTVPGNVSFRDTESGTWYIEELTEVLTKYHKRESLQHILVLVNESVSKHSNECHNEEGNFGRFTQVPAPQHTLTKQLWF